MSAVAPPIAVVRGEPMPFPPKALYIPPAALRLMLEDFEGPMDLLLFLVRKHKFDILDIPMTLLCRQYAAYVEEIVSRDLELAADYLTMSALLLEIKTKMLLPRPPAEEAEEDDPRADLVRRLLEYDLIRKAAQEMSALPRRGRDFASPRVVMDLPPVSRKPLLRSALLASAIADALARQRLAMPYLFRRELASVREVMSAVLRRLRSGARMAFRALAAPAQGGVTFLALLHLAAERMAILEQEHDGAELYARIRDGER